MTWYAVVEDATGRLISTGEVLANPLPVGMVALTIGSAPGDKMWDEVTRTFIARPPKVFIDRFTDLLARPGVQTLYNSLTTARKTQLRDALIWLLNKERYRLDSEDPRIGFDG